jgi:hypothetical protein
MKSDVVFLPGYAPNLSKRHKELIKSAALSHAGSAAHRRRRRERKGHVADEDVPAEGSATTKRGGVRAIVVGSSSGLRAWHGNSDPFDVAGVVYLSPRVADILHFVRSHYLPAPFAAPPHSRAMVTPWVEDHVREGFKSILASLQEPSCAQAYVYSAAVGMSLLNSGDQNFSAEKFRMKGQALNALRDQFSERIQDQLIILRTSEYLFSAAVMERDANEAKMHGAIVRDLLYAKAVREGFASINSSFLLRIVFKDSMLSELSNTPTIFDMHIWEPVLVASLAPTEDMLPDLVPPFDEPLDDFLVDDELRAIFTDARRALWAYRRPWIVYSGYAGQYWAYSRLVVLQSRAINRYVDACRGYLNSLDPESPTGATKDLGQKVEACLMLAVLLFASLFRCRLEQLFYHNTAQLLKQLQEAIEPTLAQLIATSNYSDRVDPIFDPRLGPLNNALLWSLFIGAVVEVQTSDSDKIILTTGTGKKPANPDHLLAEFHNHIRRMNITSWATVERILSSFVYSPQLLHPDDRERDRLLGQFSTSVPELATTPPDEQFERPWLCHEANFTDFLNRTESLRGSVLRGSTDRR